MTHDAQEVFAAFLAGLTDSAGTTTTPLDVLEAAMERRSAAFRYPSPAERGAVWDIWTNAIRVITGCDARSAWDALCGRGPAR